ncbi:hypothetical protein M422DRAFT_39078 [Sphaerobolus stellatus SS14]|uniref:protein disulfide-isomerase n=1 Tax=Sphaerobolus stellatus (strain SS14) TaxID=990650 RepID=A0A0C9UGQ8_SPHS4|nr:hypothetical protein M422DRAFT_39078 [Sphaerobolus stellatus SS14]
MYSLLRFVVVLASVALPSAGSSALNVEESNWDTSIGKGKSAFIEFWAPWCEHCERLNPIFDELADTFSDVKDKLVIAKVNVDVEGSRALIERYGVTGLPTMKYINERGNTEEYDPQGPRSLEDLAAYLSRKSGLKSRLPPPPPPPPVLTKKLTAETFDNIVMNPDKDVLVAFTAPYSAHSQTLQPIYDRVSWDFRNEKQIIIAQLEVDGDPRRIIGTEYNITSYPIIKLFPKGSNMKAPNDFLSTRDELSFVEFLNEHTGTQRAVGGGLFDTAGRIFDMDELVKEFMVASQADTLKIYEKAIAQTITQSVSGKQYLRVMEKLIRDNKGDYLVQEGKRLGGILEKRALSDDKLDEIKIKSNILASFVQYLDSFSTFKAPIEATKPVKEEL